MKFGLQLLKSYNNNIKRFSKERKIIASFVFAATLRFASYKKIHQSSFSSTDEKIIERIWNQELNDCDDHYTLDKIIETGNDTILKLEKAISSPSLNQSLLRIISIRWIK